MPRWASTALPPPFRLSLGSERQTQFLAICSYIGMAPILAGTLGSAPHYLAGTAGSAPTFLAGSHGSALIFLVTTVGWAPTFLAGAMGKIGVGSHISGVHVHAGTYTEATASHGVATTTLPSGHCVPGRSSQITAGPYALEVGSRAGTGPTAITGGVDSHATARIPWGRKLSGRRRRDGAGSAPTAALMPLHANSHIWHRPQKQGGHRGDQSSQLNTAQFLKALLMLLVVVLLMSSTHFAS